MIDRINDNSLINTQSLQSQEMQNAQAVSNSALKNAYGIRNTNLFDESDISQEAVNLYQREQEISKYKEFLNNISEEEATNQVIELMEKGVINISEEELAESMFNDLNLLNELFNE